LFKAVSHVSRLAWRAGLTVGILLGLAFAGIVLAAYKAEMNSLQTRMKSVAKQVRTSLHVALRPIELEKVQWGDTAVSVAVYEDSRLVSALGGIRPLNRLGFHHTEDSGGDFFSWGESDRGYTVVAAVDWMPIEDDLQRLGLILAGLWLPLVGMVSIMAGWAARATFSPLRDLTRQATRLGRGEVSRRLEVRDDAEFQEFTNALNGFLERLEGSIRREERFAIDLAHELRTPLTSLRGRIETTLRQGRDAENYELALSAIGRDVDRVIALSEALLLSTTTLKSSGTCDLAEAVHSSEARWLDRFVNAGVGLDSTTESSLVSIDGALVEILLDNLLGNALRVSPPGTMVNIRCVEGELSVEDEGPGVETGTEKLIFDRFYRSKIESGEGFGVGLSICQRLVDQANGRIRAENRETGGLRVTVQLPTVKPVGL
jgi:signal transduction histidine kinase